MRRTFAIPASLLLLLSVVLTFNIPQHAAGLLALYRLIAHAGIVAAIGLTTLYILLAVMPGLRRVRPVLLGILLWILLPVSGGPIIASILLDGLMAYYSSEAFIDSYKERLALTIEPLERHFEYNCAMRYTTTYRITAAQDISLHFAVGAAGQEIYGYFAYETIAAVKAALAEQFTPLWEEYISNTHNLGIFGVPRGEYLVTLSANQPFALEVHYPAPLWTPGYFLMGERSYPLIYMSIFPTPQSWTAISFPSRSAMSPSRRRARMDLARSPLPMRMQPKASL